MKIPLAARIIAVNLGLLLILAAAAEVLFGAWFSSDPLDHLGILRNASTVVDARPLYPEGAEFLYRRDRWGFRGAGVDPSQVSIVTIGGSTTNQLYLPDERTWQAVMGRELAGQGHPVVVANAGLDGQSTVGHVKVLEDWLPNVPGLKPRFVLAYVGVNDVHLTGTSIDQLTHSSIWKRLRQDSAIIRLWNTAKGMVAARRQRLVHHAEDYAHARWTDKPNQPGLTPDLGPYKERLRRMADLIHAMGAAPVFVTQTRGDARLRDGQLVGLARDGMNGLDEARLLGLYNAATLDVCHERGLLCLDLARELRFEDGDFYDLVHNTPQGAEKIGRWLAGKLAGLV